jgi:hypothetical protein
MADLANCIGPPAEQEDDAAQALAPAQVSGPTPAPAPAPAPAQEDEEEEFDQFEFGRCSSCDLPQVEDDDNRGDGFCEGCAEESEESKAAEHQCSECILRGIHGMSPQPDESFEYYYCDEHYNVVGTCTCEGCGIEMHASWDLQIYPNADGEAFREYCRSCGRSGGPHPDQAPPDSDDSEASNDFFPVINSTDSDDSSPAPTPIYSFAASAPTPQVPKPVAEPAPVPAQERAPAPAPEPEMTPYEQRLDVRVAAKGCL